MEIFGMALRNVFRNPRRTVLNMIAIGLGVMIVLTMKGWISGFSEQAFQTQIDLDTANAQILQKDYEDEARRLPLDLRITDWQAVKVVAQSVPQVVAVGARLDFAAGLSNGVSEINVMVRGVDPAGEAATNTIPQNIRQGSWFMDPNQVIIGSGMAQKLGLHVGDQIFLNALDQYSVRNLVVGTVGGIFDSGYGIFDDQIVYITLTKAQETLSLGPGDATRVVVKFKNGVDISRGTLALQKALNHAGLGQNLRAYPWQEFARTLVDTIDSRIRVMFVMLFILVILVAVGILNSMSMSVQERFQEIGTLRAIGMNRRKLSRLFLAEGFFLGLAGGLAGLAGAAGLAWLGLSYGIDARGFLPKDVPIPMLSVMKPAYSLLDFPLVAILAALLATAGALVPARRAGKMIIRDALGSHV